MTLIQSDLKKIGQIVETKLEEKLTEKLKYFPTKSEFFSTMDEVMGELKAIREEMTMVTGRLSDHEDRIASLEEIHPGGQHPTT